MNKQKMLNALWKISDITTEKMLNEEQLRHNMSVIANLAEPFVIEMLRWGEDMSEVEEKKDEQ